MIDLIVTICLADAPDRCKEVARRDLPMTVQQCHGFPGLTVVVEVMQEYSAFNFKKWTCREHAQEKVTPL